VGGAQEAAQGPGWRADRDRGRRRPHDDALAIVACEIKTGYVWPLDIIERPENLTASRPRSTSTTSRSRTDGASVTPSSAIRVWRCLLRPAAHRRHPVEGWQNEFGEKRVIKWETYRQRPIAWAVRNFENAV
jgi:hypothetical protein